MVEKFNNTKIENNEKYNNFNNFINDEVTLIVEKTNFDYNYAYNLLIDHIKEKLIQDNEKDGKMSIIIYCPLILFFEVFLFSYIYIFIFAHIDYIYGISIISIIGGIVFIQLMITGILTSFGINLQYLFTFYWITYLYSYGCRLIIWIMFFILTLWFEKASKELITSLLSILFCFYTYYVISDNIGKNKLFYENVFFFS